MELPDFSIFDDKINAVDIYVDYFVASYHRKIYEARLSRLTSKLEWLERMKSEVENFKAFVETHLSPIKNTHHDSIIRKISILSLSLTCLQTNIQIDDETYQRFKIKDVYVSADIGYESEPGSYEDSNLNVHDSLTERFNSQTYIKLELNELMFFARWMLFSSDQTLNLSHAYKVINDNFHGKELEIYNNFLYQIEHDPFSIRELS